MSTSVATLGCGGVPTLPRGAFLEPTLFKKRAKTRALLAACDSGLGWYWLLGPILFEERPSVLDVFDKPGCLFLGSPHARRAPPALGCYRLGLFVLTEVGPRCFSARVERLL